MNIDKSKIKHALNTFDSNRFIKLMGDVLLLSMNNKRLKGLNNCLLYINEDIGNIGTIVDRLIWQSKLYEEGNLTLQKWI